MPDAPNADRRTITGMPLVPEIDLIFSGYGMSKVKGLAVMPQGVQVQFENGMNVLFMPVFQGIDHAQAH